MNIPAYSNHQVEHPVAWITVLYFNANMFLFVWVHKNSVLARTHVLSKLLAWNTPDRFLSHFSKDDIFTDNTNISVFPWDGTDEVYALTETSFMQKIDVATLETLERVRDRNLFPIFIYFFVLLQLHSPGYTVPTVLVPNI